jgi:hypothetical protein
MTGWHSLVFVHVVRQGFHVLIGFRTTDFDSADEFGASQLADDSYEDTGRRESL